MTHIPNVNLNRTLRGDLPASELAETRAAVATALAAA